uniref:Uncharacterized protein n=1 Tax=Esox lucius TaxID=8010 RepID=A0A3P8XW45_ESOLU
FCILAVQWVNEKTICLHTTLRTSVVGKICSLFVNQIISFLLVGYTLCKFFFHVPVSVNSTRWF